MALDTNETLAPFRSFLELFDRAHHAAYRQQVESVLIGLCEKGRAAGKGFDPNFLGQILHYLRLVHQERRSQTDKSSASKLRRIVARARELRESVTTLRRCNFVVAANLAGKIPTGDLLHLDLSSPESIAGAELPTFDTLIGLSALAKWYKWETLHGTDGNLDDLCRYIKARTGAPHYADLVKILQPLRIRHAETEDSLKMWRARLVKKVTRKSRKRAV